MVTIKELRSNRVAAENRQSCERRKPRLTAPRSPDLHVVTSNRLTIDQSSWAVTLDELIHASNAIQTVVA
jgi:hypothetical protein